MNVLNITETIGHINAIVGILLLLAGTNIWTLVLWVSERKKRKNENAKSKTDTIQILLNKNEELTLKITTINATMIDFQYKLQNYEKENEQLRKEVEMWKQKTQKWEEENQDLRAKLKNIVDTGKMFKNGN